MRIAFTGNMFPFGEGIAYGGERILYYLIQELSKLGHEIYLFTKEGCNIPDGIVKDYIPVGKLEDGNDIHFNTVSAYAKKHGFEFDIYQCNYFGESWTESTQERWPYVELTWNRWCHAAWQLKKYPFNVISYSKVLQQDFKQVGIDTIMIHYGIPKDLYQFQPEHDNYAVWIGKIEAGKAPSLAIKLAKAAGLKIVIMGPPYSTTCFYNEVAPYIDNEHVFWVRGVDDQQKQKIMSRAKVFISSNANIWREHFGIVNAESLAMGVPIIAFNRINQDCAIKTDGIIEDGKQGFFLNYKDSNNVDEILEKGVPLLNKIHEIDRQECRHQFERHFTSELMAQRYNWLYNQVTQGKRFATVEIPV